MATVRRFCCNDLLRLSSVNLDRLVVTATVPFYLNCLAKWSDYFLVSVTPRIRSIGYIIGVTDEVTDEVTEAEMHLTQFLILVVEVTEEDFEKPEGEYWKGLIVAVTVASEYRRRGYGRRLIRLFEQLLVDKMLLSPWDHEYYTFVYVLIDNIPAKKMFEQCGYEDTTRISPDFYMREDEGQDSNEMSKVVSEEEPSLLRWTSNSRGKC